MSANYNPRVNPLTYVLDFFKAIYFLLYTFFTIVKVNIKYKYYGELGGYFSQFGDFIHTTLYQSDLKSEEVQ